MQEIGQPSEYPGAPVIGGRNIAQSSALHDKRGMHDVLQKAGDASVDNMGRGLTVAGRQIQVRARGFLFTLAIPVAVELSNDTSLHIPNPPALLVLAVVLSAFDGGIAAGLISGVFSLVFIGYYFSIPGSPFHYTDENFRRVIVWA